MPGHIITKKYKLPFALGLAYLILTIGALSVTFWGGPDAVALRECAGLVLATVAGFSIAAVAPIWVAAEEEGAPKAVEDDRAATQAEK